MDLKQLTANYKTALANANQALQDAIKADQRHQDAEQVRQDAMLALDRFWEQREAERGEEDHRQYLIGSQR